MKTTHILMTAVLALAVSGAARAGLPYRKVVESGVLDPSGSFIMGGFGSPALSDGKVAFAAAASSSWLSPDGIYTDVRGAIEAVATKWTPIPRDYLGFSSSVDISGDSVAFRRFGAEQPEGTYQPGIYKWANGAVEIVADASTRVPGRTETFSRESFGSFAIHGGDVAFVGGHTVLSDSLGIYARVGGTLQTMLAPDTTLPGQTQTLVPYGSGPPIDFDGSQVGFGSGRSPWGWLVSDGVDVEVIVNLDTPPLGTGSPFHILKGDIGHDSGRFLFSMKNAYTEFTAAFLGESGNLQRIFDETWRSPDGGWIKYPERFALDADNILFIAQTTLETRDGLFAWRDDQIVRLLGPGDTLDDKTVTLVRMTDSGLDGDEIAVAVSFDGSSAIYVLTIPEPATLSLLALGALAVLGRRKR